MYTDFEALLVKIDEEKGKNTRKEHKYEALSYGYIVKVGEEVPLELKEEHDTGLVIYRGSDSSRT